VNDCIVTYNDAIIRRDGTGRGRRHGHGDAWKKNRVTTNGGGADESSWYIILLLYIYGNRRLSCANKINAYVDSRSAESLGGGISVQYYI